MGFEHLLELLGALDEFDVRLGGGWGIDVLFGAPTREHHDVDLFVPVGEVDSIEDKLISLGYVVTEDDRPCRIVLQTHEGSRVDLNGLSYTSSGDAYQHDRDGGFELFPTDCWCEVTVAGYLVICLSPWAQRIKHGGYPIRPIDLRDLALIEQVLVCSTNLSPPSGRSAAD